MTASGECPHEQKPLQVESIPLHFMGAQGAQSLKPRAPQSTVLLTEEQVASWLARHGLNSSLLDLKMPLARARVVHEGSILNVINLGSTAQPALLFANLRKAVGSTVADARAHNLPTLELELDAPPANAELNTTLHEILSESLGLVLYTYKFRKAYEENKSVMDGLSDAFVFETLQIRLSKELSAEQNKAVQKALERGAANADSYNFARYLGDTPANELTPRQLAQVGCDRLQGLATCQVLEFEDLEKKGFGGIVAVGKGSKNKPCVAVFDSNPAQGKTPSQKTLVLVGKGLTFDTGGYSIKGKQHHDEMKYDMCGAANVIAALEVLLRAQPQKEQWRVVGLLACAENMVSEHAQRPGDVYTSYNGKTVEVYNTDAEGRLVLADVLAYAQTFAPSAIVDIATLTGGATSIAGNMAGVVCVSDEKLLPEVRAASALSGEKFVYLEILPESTHDLKSLVADYTNMHNKWSTGAPTMYASAFLKEFVPANTDWIHLDIANVAWHGRDNGYMATSGATAFGARTMVAWAKGRMR